jgi:hypothetical protein
VRFIFLLSFPILLNSFVVEAKGTAMSEIEAHKIAVENARAKAVLYFNTRVSTQFTNKSEISNGKVSKNTSFQSQQKASGTLKLLHVFDEKTEYEHYKEWTLFTKKLSAEFKIVKTNEVEKKTKIVEKHKEVIEAPKVIKKPETPKKHTIEVSEKYNFILDFDFKIKNRYWKNLEKYLLLIPENEFKNFSNLKLRFSKKGKIFSKISKYLHKIDDKFQTKLKAGQYRFLILIGDEFLLTEANEKVPNFRKVSFQKSFKKKITISDSNFRSW